MQYQWVFAVCLGEGLGYPTIVTGIPPSVSGIAWDVAAMCGDGRRYLRGVSDLSKTLHIRFDKKFREWIVRNSLETMR